MNKIIFLAVMGFVLNNFVWAQSAGITERRYVITGNGDNLSFAEEAMKKFRLAVAGKTAPTSSDMGYAKNAISFLVSEAHAQKNNPQRLQQIQELARSYQKTIRSFQIPSDADYFIERQMSILEGMIASSPSSTPAAPKKPSAAGVQ